MDQMDQKLCLEAVDIYDNWFQPFINMLVIVLNCTGSVLSSVVIYALARKHIFNTNGRIIVMSLFLGMIVKATLVTFRSIRQLIKIFSGDPCSLVEVFEYCQASQTINVRAQFMSVWAYPAFCIERITTFCLPNLMERISFPILGIVLTALMWISFLIAFFQNFNYAFITVPSNPTYVSYCSLLNQKVLNVFDVISVDFPINLLAITLLLFVRWLTKSRLRDHLNGQYQGLQYRYHQREMLRATKAIVLISLFHCANHFVNITWLYVTSRLKWPNLETYAVHKEIASLVAQPIFIVFMPILYLIFCKELRSMIPFIKETSNLSSINHHQISSTEHIEMITKSWEKASIRKEDSRVPSRAWKNKISPGVFFVRH